MNDEEFIVFLALLMVSDPWPIEKSEGSEETLKNWANIEAKKYGFPDWQTAYQEM